MPPCHTLPGGNERTVFCYTNAWVGRVLGLRYSVTTRLLYCFGFTLATIFALVLKARGDTIFRPSAEDYCGTACWNYLAVSKISFGMVLYHAFLMLLLVGVQSGRSPAATLQNELWPLKFAMWVGTLVGPFYIGNSFYTSYWIACLVFSAVFHILEAILFISFAYSMQQFLVAQMETGVEAARTTLLTVTSLSYAIIITVSGLLYHYYSRDCPLVQFFVSFNLVLLLLTSFMSILPSVQEANPSSGLLQAAILGLNNTYLLVSAVINNSLGCGISGQGGSLGDARWVTATQIIGAILTILAISYSAFHTGSSHRELLVSGGGDNPVSPGSELDDEQEAVRYNYSFFHFVFVLAAFYLGSVLNNWDAMSQSDASATSASTLQIDRGVGAMWIKMATSWLLYLLYGWTLIAPILFPNRDFGS